MNIKEVKESLFKKFVVDGKLVNQEAKVMITQAMSHSIRRTVDFECLARKFLVIDPLPPIAVPQYDLDSNMSPVVLDKNFNCKSIDKGSNYVFVDIFDLEVSSELGEEWKEKPASEILDKHVQNLKTKIMQKETELFFKMVEFMAERDNNVIEIKFDKILDSMTALNEKLEDNNLYCSNYAMNIDVFADYITAVENIDVGTDYFSSHNQRVYFKGAEIRVTKHIKENTIIAIADLEFVGVLPIRGDIEVLCQDLLNFTAVESIGMSIINQNSIAVGRIV
jgi:hypothetical protein